MNLGWVDSGPKVWPAARIFSPRMIKSGIERLPTNAYGDGGWGGGRQRQAREASKDPKTIKSD